MISAMRYIPNDAIYRGLNADTKREDYVRCARCGFPCKLSRDVHMPWGSRGGWGLIYERVYIDTTIITSPSSEDLTASPVYITTESGVVLTDETGQPLEV